jgi:transposase
MGLVEGGKITLGEAAKKIGVSYRQAKRIRRALRVKGVKGIIHGNTGRAPWNRTADPIRQKVLELSKQLYGDFNDMHFMEKLCEDQQIDLSRETVRKLRRRAGIEPKRRRRAPGHRKRRERKAQEGAMVLWNGSPHHWFGSKSSPCCLMAAIDDATGKLLAARFFPFEGSSGYLWLLKEMVKKYGIPMIIYQDRLIAELRLKGIETMEKGNRFLQSTFLKDFNRRYIKGTSNNYQFVTPAQAGVQ